MRKCKECYREFDDTQLFCQFDGEMLKDNIIFKGTYLIKEKIGGGGMGFVYEAEHLRLKYRLAIKILQQESLYSDSQARNRFKQEAEIIAKLEHDNIIKVTDYDVESNYAFFVMEYLSGKTLEQKIHKPERLSLEKISTIFSQICSAIEYAHKKGILHRDLKPTNIFLITDANGSERVKILDFGIAKILDPEQTKITKTMSIIGTPSYMSPEQCNSEKDIDRRSDIYSLGVILYEMISGKAPFESESPINLLVMHVSTSPKAISESGRKVSPQIEDVVQRALAKRREDRQQSAEQLAKDFNLAIQKRPTAEDKPREDIPIKNETEQKAVKEESKGQFNINFGSSQNEQVNVFQGTTNIGSLKSDSPKNVNKEEDGK